MKDKLEQFNNQIKTLEKNIENNEREYNSIESYIEDLQYDLNRVEEKIDYDEEEIQIIKKEMERLKTSDEYRAWEEEIEENRIVIFPGQVSLEEII